MGFKLLVLDSSFSYEAIVNRNLQTSVTCRDLDGFFEHVWTVHPFATLVTSPDWCTPFGRSKTYLINKNNTFIEGKIGFSRYLAKFQSLNFLVAQFSLIYSLYKLIKFEKINVIRAGDPLYIGLLCYIISKLTGIPFLVRVGSNNEKIRLTTNNRIMPRLFNTMNQERFVERFVLKRADFVAGANIDNLKYAISFGADSSKSTIFRYGNLIDQVHFSEPHSRKKPEINFIKKPFLLSIARLEKIKKVEDVIRVLAGVRSCGFDVSAIVVGDGRERSNLETFAIELGVQHDVIFCGNKDQNWLASIIPYASVFLSPHTGRALTEASLGGIPVVAYDIDWQSELIESGITGELVAYGDCETFTKRTLKILNNRYYALKVGSNLREKTLKMMDPFILNSHEIKTYSHLINGQ